MKKAVLIMILLAGAGVASAQLPQRHCGDPGYLYSPECEIGEIWYHDRSSTGWPETGGFDGSGFHAYHDTVVYGVSVPMANIGDFPYLWVYLVKARVHSYAYSPKSQDTMPLYTIYVEREELYSFIDHPPVAQAEGVFESRGRHTDVMVQPMCDFYFNQPCNIDSGDHYFVGIGHSFYNAYNHRLKDDPDPEHYHPSATFIFPGGTTNASFTPPDSQLYLQIRYFPESRYPAQYTPILLFLMHTEHTFCFQPIMQACEGEEANPRQVDPIGPEAVTGLRLGRMEEGWAVMQWDSAVPSAWGPEGMRVYMYQLQYAEYQNEYAEGDTLDTTVPWVRIAEELDTTKFYKARCRAKGYHGCDVHDTLMWGPWSEEAYFYTGTRYPDTVPLECAVVEGFRQEGMRGGRPHFEWERSVGHTEYEVEYAPERASWSRERVSHRQWTMPQGVEPGREYRVRVRAKCVHQCYIHDTVIWGPWSEIVRVTMPGDVGMPEAEGSELFELVPNPARGEVTVLPKVGAERLPAVLTVTDMQGREVRRVEVHAAAPQRVELAGLPSGTYMVTLTCRDKATGRQRMAVE